MKFLWGMVILLPLLFGCAGDEHADLKAFMESTGRDGAEKLEPLPPVRPPDTFQYVPDNLEDPFKQRVLKPTRTGSGFQPDFDRPKEPLEAYPLDALRMVGQLRIHGKLHALVRSPDGVLHKAQVGSHIGQNYGVITAINEFGLDIEEITEDSVGDWTKTKTSLAMQE